MKNTFLKNEIHFKENKKIKDLLTVGSDTDPTSETLLENFFEHKTPGNIIERVFTVACPGYEVYNSVEWKNVDVCIKDYQTGEVIFEGHDLEFPEHYSQQACDIIASKYFFRNIDGKGTSETSLKQVVHRMALFWTEALLEEGVLELNDYTIEGKDLTETSITELLEYNLNLYDFNYTTYSNVMNNSSTAQIFYDECVYTLLHQMWAPNSPQWFNTGIKLAYGISGDCDEMWHEYEHFNYDDSIGSYTDTVKDRYTFSQTSACFIIPITDHIIGKDSITDHYVTETKLFKGGSGVGTNFSPIRAAGESLSSGGKSSGVMSFLLGLDRNAGAIKSGGTTRRAAKMVILDIDHPDIEEFIDWKVHEEKKARDLISLGYDGGMNGEAYQTVSGQNSNNSVRVSKEFMNKITGEDPNPYFELTGRVDDSLNRTVNAKELWDKIARAAWECADPGIQFDDRYNEWNTAANDGRINATNPCSEFAFLDNSACNLASINIAKFNDLSTDHYRHIIHLIQLVLEASIKWGQYPTKDVAHNSYKYRPTGLGLCNLGSLFLQNGLAYDSPEARDLAAKLCAFMTAQSYITSTEIAEIVGACEGFSDNATPMIDVLEKHRSYTKEYTYEYLLFTEAIERAKHFGVRNMQTTVMAPTGTISLAMDCETTGIEPFFSHVMYKKCSDGSVMEMVNPLVDSIIDNEKYWNDIEYWNNGKFVSNLKPYIEEYFEDFGTYQGCESLSHEAQEILATANEIDPMAHVKMMAAIQPFISGSISKTVNLPNDATIEDIKKIYEYAYTSGCKSISIYRDGSKGTQPLNVSLDEEDDNNTDSIEAFEESVKSHKKVQIINTYNDPPIRTKAPYKCLFVKGEKPIDVTFEVADYQKYLVRSDHPELLFVGSNKPINILKLEESDLDNLKSIDREAYENKAQKSISDILDNFDYDVTDDGAWLEELPYNDAYAKNEFEPINVTIGVCDNQNYLVRASQEHLWVESNQPIDAVFYEIDNPTQEEDQKQDENQKQDGIIQWGADPFQNQKCKYADKQEYADSLISNCNISTDFKYTTAVYSPDGKIDMNAQLEDLQVLVLAKEGDSVIACSTGSLDNTRISHAIEVIDEIDDRFKHVALPEEYVPKRQERIKPEGVRRSTTHTAKIGNIELYITVSYYENGNLCEVFVSSDKEGTTIKGLLSSLSKSISHMLQYGIEPEKIATMLRNQQYEPAGHVERHPNIKMCTSISDLIARVIELEVNDYSRIQIKPQINENCISANDCLSLNEEPDDLITADNAEQAIDALTSESLEPFMNKAGTRENYTGSECPICHSTRMVQNGSCELCLDCGATTGCS